MIQYITNAKSSSNSLRKRGATWYPVSRARPKVINSAAVFNTGSRKTSPEQLSASAALPLIVSIGIR